MGIWTWAEFFASSAKLRMCLPLPPTPATSVGFLQHFSFIYGVFNSSSLPSANEQGADGGTQLTSEVISLDIICFENIGAFLSLENRE